MKGYFETAIEYAEAAHKGQTRKFTGLPYMIHLHAVANTVRYYEDAFTVRVAYLHDIIEDTDVTYDDLVEKFGSAVAGSVRDLTNVPKKFGNRADRKRADNDRLAIAPGFVQSVKLADILDNVPSMLGNDPDFGLKYLKEKLATVEVLTAANPELRELTARYLERLYKKWK